MERKPTFENAVCPECGEPPCSILELIEISTPIESTEGGVFVYSGDSTEMHYDTSKTKIDDEGKVELTCESEHSWTTELLSEIEVGEG